jgi:uncharacterized protein YmfQ (DUF2313 family)
MTDNWSPHSASDYAQVLTDLLPTGQAWRGADVALWNAGAGMIWGDIDAAAADLLVNESDPRAAVTLLPDWERNWGLPDPCLATPPVSTAQRQAALFSKMTTQGGQSRAFFISAAASLGYAIRITERSPYVCGLSRCGDTRNPQGDYRWECGPATIRYCWTVHVKVAGFIWARCGVARCGADPMLTIIGGQDLQCRFARWKPAHTSVFFDFTAIAPPPSGPGVANNASI